MLQGFNLLMLCNYKQGNITPFKNKTITYIFQKKITQQCKVSSDIFNKSTVPYYSLLLKWGGNTDSFYTFWLEMQDN